MVAKPQTDSALVRLYRLMARVREAEKARASGLLASEAFEEQLNLERARADRSGQPFVLIIFTVHGVENQEQADLAERALASALFDRTRISDAKGYYGEQVATILPYTSKEDAAYVLDPLEGVFRKKLAAEGLETLPGPRLTFTIFEYPDDERKRSGSRGLRGRESASSGATKMRLHNVS
ncbi:MAG TPA: hypothetical protein PLJ47_04455 [Candidatus Hydrogenedentes bacterium]|nr:hypothetical protein [Candidatus Hydrogenedentota bacterium]